MTKLIRTVLLDEDDNVLSMAETTVENADDIERHLENWHALKTALKRSELVEEDQAKDAEEKLSAEALTEPH